MKKVIKKLEKDNVVLVTDTDQKKYYGVINRFDDKGFITKDSFYSKTFTVKCCEDITIGNGFDMFNEYSINEIIDELLSHGFTVYEFNTYKELFRWLE